jgi:CheY-like chemotaxis protein
VKILFIEDNPEFSQYTTYLLENNGYEVDVVDEADLAVDKISMLEPYKLILLDMMLMRGEQINPNEGEETGIALYKRIRNKNKDIPILVLSAIGKDKIWHYFSKDANAMYHGKPILSDYSEFLSKIRRLVK